MLCSYVRNRKSVIVFLSVVTKRKQNRCTVPVRKDSCPVRNRKAERVPIECNWSRAADTTKIFDGKFLVVDDSCQESTVLYKIYMRLQIICQNNAHWKIVLEERDFMFLFAYAVQNNLTHTIFQCTFVI